MSGLTEVRLSRRSDLAGPLSSFCSALRDPTRRAPAGTCGTLQSRSRPAPRQSASASRSRDPMRPIDHSLDFLPRTLDPLRVYRADPDRMVRRDGRYVLYWTQICRRPRHNHALNYAVERANELGLPVVVYEGLRHD